MKTRHPSKLVCLGSSVGRSSCLRSPYQISDTIGKARKESGEFIGAEGVREHLKNGPPRRRVGFMIEGAPARRESICGIVCLTTEIVSLFGN